jgi:hypothetical protein
MQRTCATMSVRHNSMILRLLSNGGSPAAIKESYHAPRVRYLLIAQHAVPSVPFVRGTALLIAIDGQEPTSKRKEKESCCTERSNCRKPSSAIRVSGESQRISCKQMKGSCIETIDCLKHGPLKQKICSVDPIRFVLPNAQRRDYQIASYSKFNISSSRCSAVARREIRRA